MLPKKCKTPIRYCGGKSRATKTLMNLRPKEEIHQYIEPFVGGGSMAIAFARNNPGIPVWINDIYYNLYSFWVALRDDCLPLQEILYEKKQKAMESNTHRELFEECKERISNLTELDDHLDIAWRFYVLNKCSFSGLGESSGFSAAASISNFSEAGINNLIAYSRLIKNWKITNLDYSRCLTDDMNTFVYLDPPYAKVGKDGKSFLYGKGGEHHKSFDHQEFHDTVEKHVCPMMISYDNNDLIKSMYTGWNQLTFDLTYTLHSGKSYREDEKNRKELLLTNYPPS